MLDLTRIIAGPVCGRTLAVHGADVLLITASHLPGMAPLIIDNGRGKLSAHLDLREADARETLARLIRDADVFVQGYRPAAIAAFGFGPQDVERMRPGTGRKSENIKRIRAIWQEDDHGHGGPFPPRSVIDTRSKGTGGKSRPVVGDRRVGAASLCTGYHPLRSRSDRRPQKA